MRLPALQGWVIHLCRTPHAASDSMTVLDSMINDRTERPRRSALGTGSPPVCLIGQYPFGRQGGAMTYLRLHGRAVRRAGFAPHLFWVGPRTESIETDFGVLHVIRPPVGAVRPARDARAPLHAPWLAPAVERFGARLGQPLLIHGLSLWGVDRTGRGPTAPTARCRGRDRRERVRSQDRAVRRRAPGSSGCPWTSRVALHRGRARLGQARDPPV